MSTDSTTDRLDESPSRGWERRVGALLLLLVVVAALSGFLGTRTATVSSSAGDYELEVQYGVVGRAGQPAPLHIRVTAQRGFSGPTLQLALCDHLFDALDFQNWYPVPSAERGESDRVVYEFDTPAGNTFETSLDARVGPGELGGLDECDVSVLEEDNPVVSVSFRTWRLP